MEVYGGEVPLAGDAHWNFNIEGLCGGELQEVAMDPSLTVGDRKRLTDLDVAGLVDIGWELPEPGDADSDGTVDAGDYVTLKANMGKSPSSTWAEGDFDFDGQVTWLDLMILEAGVVGAAQAPPIPEPGSAMLLMCGAGWLIRRRR